MSFSLGPYSPGNRVEVRVLSSAPIAFTPADLVDHESPASLNKRRLRVGHQNPLTIHALL